MQISFPRLAKTAATLAVLCASAAHATGVIPETSVVVLDLAEGESTINVKNSESTPTLLHTSIENIPEDKEPLVIVTPPIARVEAGESQLVRFISQAKTPPKVERLKRVIFEGIPQRDDTGTAKISMTIRQNIPLIVHPKGLAKEDEPWKKLTWSVDGQHLLVKNSSPYVVRMDQKVLLQPSGALATLPRAYVLPGDELNMEIKGDAATSTGVRIFPATVYGFSVPHFDAQLSPQQAN
jgi:P pilus assembly chaperone PapD